MNSLITLLTAFLTLTACTLEKEKDGATVSLTDIKINDEIQGWEDKPGSYVTFSDVETLRKTVMNGGADDYFNEDAIEGFIQEMKSSRDTDFQGYVMDFGSEAKAQNMFEQKKVSISNKQRVGTYDLSKAIASPGLNAITVYSFFGRYYFEFYLIGYDEMDQAYSDGELFLNFYKSKF